MVLIVLQVVYVGTMWMRSSSRPRADFSRHPIFRFPQDAAGFLRGFLCKAYLESQEDITYINNVDNWGYYMRCTGQEYT